MLSGRQPAAPILSIPAFNTIHITIVGSSPQYPTPKPLPHRSWLVFPRRKIRRAHLLSSVSSSALELLVELVRRRSESVSRFGRRDLGRVRAQPAPIAG